MPTMKLQFPGGRYHATPWGHHVNEGQIEWPPSPWRLLRALIATGYTKLAWGEAVPAAGRRLIEALAITLPSYRLPQASGAHSRHYMPLGLLDKGREKTTLVFDTWANVGEGTMIIHWHCDLDEEAMALFGQLVTHLSYLGRSESWVEAQAIDDATVNADDFDAYHNDAEQPKRGWEQVALMAAIEPVTYDRWRQQAIEAALAELPLLEGTKKIPKKLQDARAKAVAPFPADLLDCLQRDTAWWKQHRWSQPPGTRRVIYWRRAHALEVSVPQSMTRPPSKTITAMLLAITTPSGNKSALPSVIRTLPVAERLHKRIVGRVAKGGRIDCAAITGRDEHNMPLAMGHQHAHILPLDMDGDQRIDHILIYAAMGLSEEVQREIHSIKETWSKHSNGKLQLAVAGRGEFNNLIQLRASLATPISRLLKASQTWITITPFVPPRYLKARGNNTLAGQVKAELESRGINNTVKDVGVLEWNETTGRLRHFMRCRQQGGTPPPVDIGFALKLTFAESVTGPLALGYGSHFGLGLFAAIDSHNGG